MESFIDDLCVEYDLRGSGLNGYIYFYLNKDAKDLIKETSIFKKNYSSVIYSSIDIGEEKDIEIAAKCIDKWDGIDEKFSFERALILCAVNPDIKAEILKKALWLYADYQEQITELLLFAEHELTLGEKQGDGVSLRHHLEALQRNTGVTPEQLISVPFPETLEFIWRDFLELNDARTSNGYTVNPISFTELDAWNRLMNKQVTAQEISIMKQLDAVFMNHYQKQQADKK